MTGRRWPGRLTGDRGSFTAELAVGLPALMLLLFAALTGVGAVTTATAPDPPDPAPPQAAIIPISGRIARRGRFIRLGSTGAGYQLVNDKHFRREGFSPCDEAARMRGRTFAVR